MTDLAPQFLGSERFARIEKKHITEEELLDLGWKRTKQYMHDEFFTNRYQLNCMEIEFTYENGRLVTCDLWISELNGLKVNHSDIVTLTKILGKHKR